MKAHFYQAINETEHLEEMESRSGNRYWVDRFLARHLVLFYYWVMVFYYLLSPSNAYDINIKIEEHAYETYAKYLTCLLYTSPSPRDLSTSRMPSSA